MVRHVLSRILSYIASVTPATMCVEAIVDVSDGAFVITNELITFKPTNGKTSHTTWPACELDC